MDHPVLVQNKADLNEWNTFEEYLERKGVTKALENALISLLNERPWPQNIYLYIYSKLGGYEMKKMKRRLIKLNKKIRKVKAEIECLSLIRDNSLEYSLYKDALNRICTEKPGHKRRKNC